MPKMTVDEYLAWAEGRPGRYELFAGHVYQMAPERAGHARVKYALQTALVAAIRRASLPCEMLPGGMTVRVDSHTAHEPDALVYCGPKLSASELEVPDPVIVAEALSPSTRHVDATAKLAGYFSRPSVRHYLIVDPDQRILFHHARGEQEVIATRIVRDGILMLDPPGLELAVQDILQAAE